MKLDKIIQIAVIGTRGFPGIQGGVEKHCEVLYPLMAASDPEVTWTVFRRKPYVKKNAPHSAGPSIQFVDLWTIRNRYFETLVHSFLAALICLVKRPGVVHVHNIGPALVLPLLKIGGLKTVVTYHSDNYSHDKWGKTAKIVLKAGERFVARWADEIIVVSRQQLGLFKNRKRVTHIPNGLSIIASTKTCHAPGFQGIQPGAYLFAAARFSPEKGLDILVDAFSSYKGSLKLVIAGDADHETSYSRGLKEKIVRDPRIIMTGYLTGQPLAWLFENAGLFVLPSRQEGLPIALIEAMGYGLPVLASDIPASREMELPDSRYFESGNARHLLEKLESLDEEGLTPEEKNGQMARISEAYDWNSVAAKTLAVFKRFMTSG